MTRHYQSPLTAGTPHRESVARCSRSDGVEAAGRGPNDHRPQRGRAASSLGPNLSSKGERVSYGCARRLTGVRLLHENGEAAVESALQVGHAARRHPVSLRPRSKRTPSTTETAGSEMTNPHGEPRLSLDGRTGIPLYVQLREQLRATILAGEWDAARALPPEQALAKQAGGQPVNCAPGSGRPA